MIKQHKLLINLTTWWLSAFWNNSFTISCLFVFSEEADVNFIWPNFFRTITKLFSRHFGGNLKKIGRVSTKRKCNIKLFHCTGFFALLEKRFSLMKYRKIFLLRLFRALYQGTDKILDFPNCIVREQELLGRIDKICTLVEQRERFIKKRMKTYVT